MVSGPMQQLAAALHNGAESGEVVHLVRLHRNQRLSDHGNNLRHKLHKLLSFGICSRMISATRKRVPGSAGQAPDVTLRASEPPRSDHETLRSGESRPVHIVFAKAVGVELCEISHSRKNAKPDEKKRPPVHWSPQFRSRKRTHAFQRSTESSLSAGRIARAWRYHSMAFWNTAYTSLRVR